MGRKKPNFQDVNPVDPQGGKLKKAMAIDDDKYEVETDSCEELMASEVRVVTVGLKKKGNKGGSRKFEPNDKIFDEMNVEEEDKDVPVGRNKVKSKMRVGKNVFGASSFELLGEDDESGTSCVEDDGDAVITFSGKKKSSIGKNNSAFSVLDDSIELVDVGQAPVDTSSKESENLRNSRHASKAVTEPLRNRKKGKKSGKAAQEEDDLEKILAEIGEGSSFTEAVPLAEGKVHIQHRVEKVDVSSEEKAGEGGEETAAQKKKRKKKEKDKEKKVAATAAAHVDEPKQDEETNETKSKPIVKKVSKHVREMQENLARLNEEIERKKRVEEEKLRKEEEERKRLEELERLEEERKRAKKEREKEKLLKKKLEGKHLTGKQKEEARRREAMRSQILANAGGLPLSTGDAADAPTKRPKYETKKSKQRKSILKGVASGNVTDSIETVKENHQDFVTKEVSMEPEIVEESDAMSIEDDQLEAASVMEGNGNGWNAKSWEDAVLKLPGEGAFSDKEESELVEKVMDPKLVVPTVLPIKSSSVKDKRSQPVKMVTDKNKPKDPVGKKSVLNENLQCNEGEKILRSPICCIMGHVDTGKTKLLDRIRGTNVQEGEAGGITQQIGATFFPAENIRERTKELKADAKLEVPGLLVIDTPGHESFKNLRSRGSGLCDIAILVVDIMHGLEPQTIESLNLLKTGNTEFIVALNKVDRLYGWKTCKNAPIVKAMKQQNKDVQIEFNTRLTQVITQFKEQGLNTELYYKNKDMEDTYNIIPTSAISGEGIPDMLLWVVQWTQKKMAEKLTYSNKVQCAVLEVKVVEGLGTTIDVILVNGVLHEGDKIVVCSLQEPIVTTVRALLTPHPMKELRVKGTYLHHKEIKAAQGIKITAQGLEHAVAGTSLYVVGPHDDIDGIKNTAMEDVKSVFSKIDKNSAGVYVQASTLGSLEALLEFLKSPQVNIPVSNISIGPAHKKDVVKASVMLEKKKEYATILAFDVKVTPEARVLADEAGVKIFTADIIYHLCDQFKSYIDKVKEGKKKEAAEEVVFPCVLEILACFNNRDPIVLGVDVLEGTLKVGTPLCISSENPSKNFMDIGRVISIQKDKIEVDCAKKGGPSVAIKISGTCADEQQKSFSRHFDEKDKLVSRISRKSIDILKKNYRDEVAKDEWVLIKKLKADFKIQ